MKMENAEEIFHFLEDFAKRKPKTIPQELNDYLAYVARTGDPVYQWSLVKSLFKEKLMNVITDFYETTPSIEIPPYPNVDPFNYDTMKNGLIERLESFSSAPFTIQRICELLTYPRKQYNRIDKFMRAIEKNILVVSTREPGSQRHIEPENGEPMEPIVNGSDNNSDYNVDVEMEDMSWKQNMESQKTSEPQPSSSDTHISVDDIEAKLKDNQDAPMEIQDKASTQYESVTPPELNITTDEQMVQSSTNINTEQLPLLSPTDEEHKENEIEDKPKIDVEMKNEDCEKPNLTIPEIKIDDAEMTEQRLTEETQLSKSEKEDKESESIEIENNKTHLEDHQSNIDESSSDSNSKEELDNNKHISDIQTSSEESSSSSDITDGSSNSPKTSDNTGDPTEESTLSDSNVAEEEKEDKVPEKESEVDNTCDTVPASIQSDNYSISDVKSELPQSQPEEINVEEASVKSPQENTIEEETLQESEKEVKEITETTAEKSST